MTAAILLAAGASTRMKLIAPHKALLDWRGQPLIAAQIDALRQAGCDFIVVVLGANAHLLRDALPDQPDVRTVSNSAWRQGRAGSIRCGARALPRRTQSVAVASVDQPVSPDALRQTIAALHNRPDALIAVPRSDGRNGHPPVLRADLIPELRQVDERGQGLRALRRRHAGCTIFVDTDDPDVLLNLNTPDRYRQARAQATP